VSRAGPRRGQELSELEHDVGRFTVQVGFFLQAVADQLGMNRTDLEVLSLLWHGGPLTAGQLAEAANLTTGAVTGVVDRLEKAGRVTREADPADRRRVIVKAVEARLEAISGMIEPMRRASGALRDTFSEAELETVRRFVAAAAPFLADATVRLRAGARPPATGGDASERSAPLGAARAGRLELPTGIARLTLRGDPALEDLFRARFDGPAPEVQVKGGTVRIAYPRFRPFDFRRQAADVTLTGAIPWTIDLRGGASHVEADLRAVPLRGLEVTGGASELTLRLGPPSGAVRVALAGGGSKVTLRRPADVPARLRVRGGASKLVFDAQRLGAVGGEIQLESPGFAGAADRYELELTGGASKLTVVTDAE
jgi:DNA-binding MarR family transcriptional regulator